ncbi:5'-methylthioadenosine/adenosylhomocysteine nucleosidase [Helicobacter cholecystus]|uniref:adenosylhomocysteine nucleosidase n=1 Tax=Helicobacter cholecystus TaxID=45498 RepID=A0A3D8IXX2_9HELI|nr:5'-methylthioadenosine/adenosylhomocysteine nucleosidase [Helicobacter cholecystus]RDU69903.1 5'-methylthioadenosine/adenosylhomocysteine nucleosidase [Helicobacter cholecystus]VEJ25052.1 5'-methylthioadenosine/S-adenosylhomocysteine nucleosidase [Helicobacter cholecystus]
MKIAILGAMREEITPFLKKFPHYTQEEVGGNTFYKIPYNGNELILAYSKIGKVHSALSASTMILKFNCEKLIFSGVAGGLNPKLKVGDLIIASKLCQYDVDITAFGHPLGFIPQSSVYIDSDHSLNQIAKEVAQQKGIDLMEGVIASGDSFIASSEKKKWLIENFQADAVEMEGASVANVCHLLKIPFCILRSISDSADGGADISFDEFLEHSAQVSADFVEAMLAKIF